MSIEDFEKFVNEREGGSILDYFEIVEKESLCKKCKHRNYCEARVKFRTLHASTYDTTTIIGCKVFEEKDK